MQRKTGTYFTYRYTLDVLLRASYKKKCTRRLLTGIELMHMIPKGPMKQHRCLRTPP
jgi:hypothetical protein